MAREQDENGFLVLDWISGRRLFRPFSVQVLLFAGRFMTFIVISAVDY